MSPDTAPDGAILVFLPGLAEITKLVTALQGNGKFSDASAGNASATLQARVLPLHSSLTSAEQQMIFDVPPPGIRKIVIATNIAETSITIEDVVFVVDAGRVKENQYDEVREVLPLSGGARDNRTDCNGISHKKSTRFWFAQPTAGEQNADARGDVCEPRVGTAAAWARRSRAARHGLPPLLQPHQRPAAGVLPARDEAHGARRPGAAGTEARLVAFLCLDVVAAILNGAVSINGMCVSQLPRCLRVQILLLDLADPAVFLGDAVDPPTAMAVENSLECLEGLQAVERPLVTEEGTKPTKGPAQLTALGYHLAQLPVSPRIGKVGRW